MKLMLGRLAGVCGLLLAGGLMISGCATTQEPAFSSEPAASQAVASLERPTNTSGPSADLASKASGVLSVRASVKITFSGPPEPPLPHDEKIKDDGTISLKWIGSVKAAGKTPGELQKIIHDLYVPKYYKDLTVTVDWVQADLYFTIGGEVRSPGPRVWSPETTVVKAIQSSGDFTEFANRRAVSIVRESGEKFKVDCKKAINDPKYDLKVLPNDIIHVPRTRW